MIPSDVVLDLSGERRVRGVRIVDGSVYGEAGKHQGTDVGGGVVRLDLTLDGEPEEVNGRRWRVGPWTVSRAGGCSCRGTNAALRAWVPNT